MIEIGGQPESSTPREPLAIQIVESYSVADRDDLAGGEKDPSQTSSYQLQWRPTEKHVFVVEAGKRICHVGVVQQIVEVQERLFASRELAVCWHVQNTGAADIAVSRWKRRKLLR